MGLRRWVSSWPVYRQLTGPDPLGRGKAAECRRSETPAPWTESADRVVSSVCPYCAVGWAQRVYVGLDEHPAERVAAVGRCAARATPGN